MNNIEKIDKAISSLRNKKIQIDLNIKKYFKGRYKLPKHRKVQNLFNARKNILETLNKLIGEKEKL